MAKLFHKDKLGPLTITDEYQDTLRREHQLHPDWGATGEKSNGDVILGILRKHAYITRVLDFGAGKGSLGRYIRGELDREITWVDYDPGISGIDEIPYGEFDMVVSTDVLEHVEPAKVDATIQLLASKTKTILISYISCMYTEFYFDEGPFEGQDLHLSVHDPIWWKEKFDELLPHMHLFIYEDRLKFGKGRYKKSCFLIHEKS